MTSSLARARAAFAERDWRAACDAYAAALDAGALTAADHERRAVAAHLIGDDATCDQAWEAACRAALDAGDRCTAARCSFWLGLCLLLRAQPAQAGGWLSRAGRLVEEASPEECAAEGYLVIAELLGVLGDDPARARDLAARAIEIGARLDDHDLRAFGVLGEGQALIAMGQIQPGVARLDEVMVSVTAGEAGPITTGIVYCAVILECMALFDVARASEWTDALGSWCDGQPDLLPYRGQCLVHRSQLLQSAGDWSAAATTVDAAVHRLTDPPHPALGLARYQVGELRRLAGDLDAAEAAYREASRLGHDPMPGLALLELARGDSTAAAASIRRALHETATATSRPALLGAAVEILQATGDVSGARAAAEELATLAASSSSPALKAMADHAIGAVLVAEGRPSDALGPLRSAAGAWRTLRLPYEGARTSVMLGFACAQLGDDTTAELELANAREAFTRLGARPDLASIDAVTDHDRRAGRLSEREREVLAHLAAGETNKEIAEALVISRHTVRRHVENIFGKLGVSSRAAATARAYEQGLISRDA